ncbi:MAG TPA: cytochrome c oxidase assembly protein [Terriglobia bacterium]|nr:cytochrome c oxidase assembly protein [Terriglobia bacterium]
MIRRVALFMGVAALAGAWASLAHNRHNQLFHEHMAVHMTVVAVAAPMLAVALAGSSLDPFRRAAPWSPLVVSLIELVVVWAWHTPAMHHFARRSALALVAEQTTFLLSGFLLWIAVVGGEHVGRRGGGIIALLVTAMHMTLLGALLALSQRAFYPHESGAHLSSALKDQHLGGVIMLLAGGVTYLVGGLWMSWKLLRYRRL